VLERPKTTFPSGHKGKAEHKAREDSRKNSGRPVKIRQKKKLAAVGGGLVRTKKAKVRKRNGPPERKPGALVRRFGRGDVSTVMGKTGFPPRPFGNMKTE